MWSCKLVQKALLAPWTALYRSVAQWDKVVFSLTKHMLPKAWKLKVSPLQKQIVYCKKESPGGVMQKCILKMVNIVAESLFNKVTS